MNKTYISLFSCLTYLLTLFFTQNLFSMEKSARSTCSIRKKVDSGLHACNALILIHDSLARHNEQEATDILRAAGHSKQNKDLAAEVYFVAIADLALNAATDDARINACKFLSHHILNPNKTWHNNSHTLLGETVRAQNMELVQLLINAGADLDISLHCAVIQNDVDLCKKLIDIGANPYTKDENDRTAFECVWKNYVTSHTVMQILKREDTWKGWIKAKIRAITAYCN